jgi:ribosomal protein L40E
MKSTREVSAKARLVLAVASGLIGVLCFLGGILVASFVVSLFQYFVGGMFFYMAYLNAKRYGEVKARKSENPAKTEPEIRNALFPRWTSLVKCPRCGHQNSLDADHCEKCGLPRSNPKQTDPQHRTTD